MPLLVRLTVTPDEAQRGEIETVPVEVDPPTPVEGETDRPDVDPV